jgi:hypothetical protein
VQWTLVAATVGLAFAGISWIATADSHGPAPHGNYEPHHVVAWTYSGTDAADRRNDALRRAVFEFDHATIDTPAPLTPDPSTHEPPECRFVPGPPSGTSPKFDCVLEGGDIVKVKYGRNPEIHAEVAGTELLRMLGYAADHVTIVPRLRCHGCPRFPFVAMHLENTFGLPLVPSSSSEGYTDFEWVSVEHKFPAPAIETETVEGWSWWELERSAAPRADVDALRLTAMFLAHWDNKDINQRLVCLDGLPPAPNAHCAHPLALIQDLGATFGPSKVNLARWRHMPIWRDPRSCTVSMAAMPFRGASFPDTQISEAGRAALASRLAAISDADVEQLFRRALFPQFQVGTDDAGDLAAWVGAFRHRADQIVRARCPDLPSGI